MRSVAVQFCLLILAACAGNVQWDKPGASQAQIDADVRKCNVEAQAVPSAAAATTAPSAMVAGPALEREPDRQIAETQRMQQCMRALGYDLKPRS
jgi:hypothetical protein